MAFLHELIGARDLPAITTGLMLAGLGTALITLTSMTSLPAAGAAARTTANTAEPYYEAVACSPNRDHAVANTGGWNHYGRYVRTPNFRLRHRCGYRPSSWFRRDQVLKVNTRTAVYGDWTRSFVRFDRCRIHGSRRVCRIP